MNKTKIISEARKYTNNNREQSDLTLNMVYNGGNIQYFGGHHLTQLTVSLYRSTTLGQLFDEILDEYNLTCERYEEYKEDKIYDALIRFYAENVQGCSASSFVTMNYEDRKAFEDEGSAFVFVFGYRNGNYIEYPR